ncbi:hypothetical protein ACJX0J_031340, partial [Zea mays]
FNGHDYMNIMEKPNQIHATRNSRETPVRTIVQIKFYNKDFPVKQIINWDIGSITVSTNSTLKMFSEAKGILMDGAFRSGNAQEALALYQEMTRLGLIGNLEEALATCTRMTEPNVVTYTALIHGHAKNGGIDAAFRLHKEMIENV